MDNYKIPQIYTLNSKRNFLFKANICKKIPFMRYELWVEAVNLD